jgi:hypothetical protein
VVRDIRIIADEGILASRLENVIYPAWGVNGGHSGRDASPSTLGSQTNVRYGH